MDANKDNLVPRDHKESRDSGQLGQHEALKSLVWQPREFGVYFARQWSGEKAFSWNLFVPDFGLCSGPRTQNTSF